MTIQEAIDQIDELRGNMLFPESLGHYLPDAEQTKFVMAMAYLELARCTLKLIKQ